MFKFDYFWFSKSCFYLKFFHRTILIQTYLIIYFFIKHLIAKNCISWNSHLTLPWISFILLSNISTSILRLVNYESMKINNDTIIVLMYHCLSFRKVKILKILFNDYLALIATVQSNSLLPTPDILNQWTMDAMIVICALEKVWALLYHRHHHNRELAKDTGRDGKAQGCLSLEYVQTSRTLKMACPLSLEDDHERPKRAILDFVRV